MNTPKIRFKGFTDDWEQRKLGDVLKERTERAKGEEELLSVTIANGVIRQADSEKRNIASEDKRNYKVVKKGDIPYNSMRMWQGAVGNSQYDGIVSPAYTILVPTDEANDKFFMELFKKENSLQRFKRWSQGLTSDTWNLKYPALSTMQFFIPSIKEQKRIANCLQELDYLITLHQRKCDETKQLKKFMLQKMFPKNGEKNPEIRFEGFTDDWEQRKLGEVAEYRNGKAHENEIDEDGEYIVVNSKFVSTNAEIRKFSNAQNEPLYENEIAFVLSDVPNGRAIARTFLVDKSGKYTLNQRIAGITPHEDTDPYYLHIRMNRNAYFLKFDDGNKQTNLSIKDVLNYEDMYPSYKEQHKIGSYFRQLDHIITLHQRKCEKLKELKKFMLQNMFV